MADDLLDTPTLLELLSPPTSLTSSAQSYLDDLPNKPLAHILSEPGTLATHSHYLTSSLTTLTQASYPTFLSLHKTTNALTSSLDELALSLDGLMKESLPVLEESMNGWKERTDSILRERKKARVVLEQHEKIRDLLDIPVLIDTCVRNGYFGEALSLANHASSLAASSSPDRGEPSLLVKSVLVEVQQSMSQMLLTLLVTLREPNRKLPALWKAVNFLKRMDVFNVPVDSKPIAKTLGVDSPLDQSDEGKKRRVVSSEELIAISFLSGRESCLKTSLDSLTQNIQQLITQAQSKNHTFKERDQDDLARFLKKYVDLWREGVYDIVSQYNTIFLEQPQSSSVSSLKSPTSPRSSTPLSTAGRPGSPSPSSSAPSPIPTSTTESRTSTISSLRTLVVTYYTHALHTYLLPLLSHALPLLLPSALPPLLTQLTYCSNAFSRVGGDFRPLLAPLFCDAVVATIGSEIRNAGEACWERKIKDAMGGSGANSNKDSQPGGGDGGGIKKVPSSWLVAPSGALAATSPRSTSFLLHVPGSPTPSSPTAASQAPATLLATTIPALKATLFAPKTPPHIPPSFLLAYPPLALYMNALLTAFNNLRLLAPVDTLPRLEAVLDEVLVKGGKELVGYVKRVDEVLGGGGGENAGEGEKKEIKEVQVGKCVGIVYWEVFVPYIKRALVEGVFATRYEEEEDEKDEKDELKKAKEEWEEFLGLSV